ncbi:MAG TPA: shikimate kinase, partial [Thermomicrobiales bacterium]|nr:shikimate kinase [Thermomicrobiales bacterium]
MLVGPSGTGKSSTARALGDLLGWDVHDTDDLIVAREGRSIPQLFAEDGEAAFRAVERQVLMQSLRHDHVVIATGGGAPANDEAWAADLLGHPETLTVHLDASPAVLVDRLRRQAALDGAHAERPLLQGDAMATLAGHRERRRTFYERATVGLAVEGRSVAGIAADIAELATLGAGVPSSLELTSTSAPSTISVGPGTRRQTGAVVSGQWPKAGRIWLCVDEHVATHYGDALSGELGLDRFDTRIVTIPSGETSKSVAGLSHLWDALLNGGVERSDVLIAVGG